MDELYYYILPFAAVTGFILALAANWVISRKVGGLRHFFLREGGLEFIKMPSLGKRKGKEVKGIELVHFKGGSALEFLEVPSLAEARAKKEKKIVPAVCLLTGKNLTGYFLLLTKMLFFFEESPIFLTIKERELEKFKKHTNILISIYRHGSEISEKLKTLRYQFMKKAISESEFRKRLAELELEKRKTMEIGKIYDGYRYFSYPVEILSDLKRFCEVAKGRGLVVLTIVDEMVLKDKKDAFEFVEKVLGVSGKHRIPVVITLEKGLFSEEAENRARSYAELIIETSQREGKRFVNVQSMEKSFPERELESVEQDLRAFLQKIGFIGGK